MTTVLAVGALLSFSVHAETLTGRIVGISDGDTVTLLDANQRQYKIRLIGIDAPEKKMPFGQRSKEHLSDLVFNKDVQVETEKLDRYGRTLGKILLDRNDINLAMINAGLAWLGTTKSTSMNSPVRTACSTHTQKSRPANSASGCGAIRSRYRPGNGVKAGEFTTIWQRLHSTRLTIAGPIKSLSKRSPKRTQRV